MEIYQIKSSPENTSYGLMARDAGGYCYVYSANTGHWHRNKARELDLAIERKAVYEPIAVEDAKRLMPGVKPADRQIMGQYVKRLEQPDDQWTKTFGEVLNE